MRILHIGVGASSEGNADRFFRDLLGLAKAEPYVLPAGLSRSIFAIERELAVINYSAEGVRCEVFVDPLYRAPAPTVLHSCFEVDDQAGLLERCAAAGLRVSRTPRGDSFVAFVADPDGNLFEIKEKK